MEGQDVISDEKGYTWATCDCCGLTMGVGFGAGLNEAKTAFKMWGWQYERGKMVCNYCVKEGRAAMDEMRIVS